MRAETAALIMMSGSADLEDITITENDVYQSVDHDGFGVVTVEVPTMVECAEEVAEILGVDTSQEWDCDDIKAKAQEVVDELEDCHDCWGDVVEALQQYDPDYDPDEGECPADKVTEVVEHAEECDDCKAEVVAKLQEYDPDFDPVTCQDIVDKIDEIEEEAEKPPQYTFEQDPTSPTYPDPNFYDNLISIIGSQDTVTDDTLGFSIVYSDTPSGTTRHRMTYKIVYSDSSEIYLRGVNTSGQVGDDRLIDFRVTDPSTGTYTYYWVGGSAWMGPYSTQLLIGYGDPTHSYTVTKKS